MVVITMIFVSIKRKIRFIVDPSMMVKLHLDGVTELSIQTVSRLDAPGGVLGSPNPIRIY